LGVTGAGAHVQASLFETAAWWMSYHLTGYLATGRTPQRQGTGSPFIVPYEVFPTAAGDILICAANDRLFAALASALRVPELTADARFATNPERVRSRTELRALLITALSARTAEDWETCLRERGIPCSRLRTVEDLAEDPQLAALGMLAGFPSVAIPELRLVQVPVAINGERGSVRSAPPELGEHTDAILDELDIDHATRDRFRQQGVIS
jgi:crotonobetainyl-CoA:carnitine CoA-transferase CaiB-like acyl-CoA transferase